VRTATTWALGYAYELQGNRRAARQSYTAAVAAAEAMGHFIMQSDGDTRHRPHAGGRQSTRAGGGNRIAWR
jgi:hypothetical protein